MSTCCRVMPVWLRYYHAGRGAGDGNRGAATQALLLLHGLAQFFGSDGFYFHRFGGDTSDYSERIDILGCDAHRAQHAMFSDSHAAQHGSVISDASFRTNLRL